MKNIWVITYNYGSVKAGPVIRFQRYVPYFNKAGCRVTFVTIERDEEYNKAFDHIALRASNVVSFLKQTCQKALEYQPDALLFLSNHYSISSSVRKIRRKGIKAIYVNTMRLNFEEKSTGIKRGFFQKQILKLISRKWYRSFDYIVNSTSTLESDFIDLGIPKSRLKIIYNGVDTHNFIVPSNEQKSTMRQSLGIPQDHIVFMFVGLLVQRKGVLELIQRWMEWKGQVITKSTLLIVGDEMENIDENSQEWLEDWRKIVGTVKDKSNNLDIVYSPFVPNIKDYYRAADTFLFFSYLEGMPNVLLESMATGLVTVTTEFDGFSKDYGQDGAEHVVLENRKKEAVLPLLTKIYRDEGYRNLLKLAARRHAEDHFGIDKSIAKYTSLF